MSLPTGLIFFPAFDWSISPTHPERQERLLYTRDQLFEEGIMDLPQIRELSAATTNLKQIYRTHICVPNAGEQVTDAHLVAVGSCLKMADAFYGKEIKNGFVLVRPPGHHAMWVVHGNRGFCNINNEAIMVNYIRSKYGVKKIAIVDTDVHHGDGTQDIFHHDPDVLCISFHQDPQTLYPGTGFIHELGGPTAFASTINIPLPPGTTDQGVQMVMDHVIMPILEDFEPELIINSAGQDNHFTDPLANLRMTAAGYARLNEQLKPHIAVLEGGYAVETALPYVNTAITLAMAGLDYSFVREPGLEEFTQSENATRSIKRTISQLMDLWKNRKKVDLDKIFGTDRFYSRQRNIYYDTEGFSDTQKEIVYRCSECSGYLQVDSRARHPNGVQYHIFAVKVPFHCCPRCAKMAQEAFSQEIDKNTHTHYYLQDIGGQEFHMVWGNNHQIIYFEE
ncbi:histone deacetylase [Candidatus Formimonas warabiya]|uniref:histone deacetylase family protein n=1 Tax=Formimonas warabiya TaxID=1761012 RepID=UPI0011D164CF|nr:histone deacetylase [Candidatus Formimonas warabiya]